MNTLNGWYHHDPRICKARPEMNTTNLRSNPWNEHPQWMVPPRPTNMRSTPWNGHQESAKQSLKWTHSMDSTAATPWNEHTLREQQVSQKLIIPPRTTNMRNTPWNEHHPLWTVPPRPTKWTPRISEAIPEMNTLNGYYRRDTRICEASPEMNTLWESSECRKNLWRLSFVSKSCVGRYCGVRTTNVLLKISQSEQHTAAIEKTEWWERSGHVAHKQQANS